MEKKSEKDWSKASIVILITVIAALIPIIVFITGKQSLPEIMAKPTPSPSPLRSLQGDWTGSATNQLADTVSEPFLVSIKFGDCALGKVCGLLRIERPGFQLCTGNILFNSIDSVTSVAPQE
jgi:hypothetical protein